MTNSAEIIPYPPPAGSASLPMYTLAEVEDTVGIWWRGLARHMREAGVTLTPETLSKPETLLDHWRSPNLIFSQTCGFPMLYLLGKAVRMVATPIYEAPGCEGPNYRSQIIVRDDLNIDSIADLENLDAAINSRDSQSGFNAFRASIAVLEPGGDRFFARTLVTGSHEGSILAVRARNAHCACVDGVTLELYRRYRPSVLEGVRILCETPAAPGLPFITRGSASNDEVQALRDGLFNALADPALVPFADQQLLKGAAVLEPEDYAPIRNMVEIGAALEL